MNLFVTEVMSEFCRKRKDVKFVSYADDLVVHGKDVNKKTIVELFNYLRNEGLQPNPVKCASFFVNVGNHIPLRRTYKYLGTILNDQAKTVNMGKIVKKLEKILKWITVGINQLGRKLVMKELDKPKKLIIS